VQGRQPADWGIPTWEAIERWTPRELWQAYLRIAENDIPLIILGGPGDPRSDEARRLRVRITEILVDKLVRGELIASGVALRLKETSRRRDIRPELWLCLTFSHRFATVRGERLTYDHVLIREARPATPSRTERTQEAARPLAQHARGPGRPSIMPKIEAEMRRRAASGQIEESLGQEAKVLSAWAKRTFPDKHVPAPQSIERRLGHIYRELDRIKRSDNSYDKI
jgi:hypothetical protein